MLRYSLLTVITWKIRKMQMPSDGCKTTSGNILHNP